jgi:hypothetical protein
MICPQPKPAHHNRVIGLKLKELAVRTEASLVCQFSVT